MARSLSAPSRYTVTRNGTSSKSVLLALDAQNAHVWEWGERDCHRHERGYSAVKIISEEVPTRKDGN
jgi:hypothetical protein